MTTSAQNNQSLSSYSKIKEKSLHVYKIAQSYLKKAFVKTKQLSQTVYKQTKQKLPQYIDKTKQKTESGVNKVKEVSSIAYDKTKQYGGKAKQVTIDYSIKAYQISSQVAYFLWLHSDKILKVAQKSQNSQKVNKNQTIMQNAINQLIPTTIITSLAYFGTSKSISLIGFKAVGILKGSLAALYQSKVAFVTSKSLFAFLQSISAKAVLTTYAPVVIPTIVITYVGYKVVLDIMQHKKIQKQNKQKNEKLKNQAQNIHLKISQQEQIYLSSLKQWNRKLQNQTKHHEKTL